MAARSSQCLNAIPNMAINGLYVHGLPVVSQRMPSLNPDADQSHADTQYRKLHWNCHQIRRQALSVVQFSGRNQNRTQPAQHRSIGNG